MEFSEDDRARLLDLWDRRAIWECMLRYARGVDRLDEALIRSAYWPDAHDSHGALNGSVDGFLAGWMPSQPLRDVAHHLLGNHLVDIEGAVAYAETYFVSAAKSVGSDSLEMVGGRYEDTFEKRGDEWRIATRLVLLDWQAIADASGMGARLERSHRGSRGPLDPSYERPVGPRTQVERPAP